MGPKYVNTWTESRLSLPPSHRPRRPLTPEALLKALAFYIFLGEHRSAAAELVHLPADGRSTFYCMIDCHGDSGSVEACSTQSGDFRLQLVYVCVSPDRAKVFVPLIPGEHHTTALLAILLIATLIQLKLAYKQL
ncbi:hypothetical protein PGTUg99_034207 [Puccinia graminis f. sp. tritici]|uniref:Uncharacterized protein n=1 Tax=Puccinia graminis f. sp. tritici TaxID=56615 RepID=A0A5B0NJF1_PUCGR|nr:hypothetical protein PGTUg99_034207 [Puccinia graminis f. sp. tritici]